MSRRAMDDETRALSSSPEFQRLIAEAREGESQTLSADELERRRPVSTLDEQYAEKYLAAVDRLEAAQGREVSDDQGRLLKAILTASDVVEARAPVAQLAEDSGVPEDVLRAAAAALQTLGDKVPAPAG